MANRQQVVDDLPSLFVYWSYSSFFFALVLYTLYWFFHFGEQNSFPFRLTINALPQCLHSFISQSESVSIKEKDIWIMTSREWKFHTITGAFSANAIEGSLIVAIPAVSVACWYFPVFRRTLSYTGSCYTAWMLYILLNGLPLRQSSAVLNGWYQYAVFAYLQIIPIV